MPAIVKTTAKTAAKTRPPRAEAQPAPSRRPQPSLRPKTTSGAKPASRARPSSRSKPPSSSSTPAPHVPDLPPGTPATLPLSVLHPSPFNKRRFRPDAAEDRELAASIRALGILEPLLVRPLTEDTYELLAGERRWRCALSAGLAEAPVVVHPVDDRTAALLLFAENFHRRDLHFLEEAETVAGLLAAGWTHDQIAGHLGRSASWVARRARLCSLAEPVRAGIADPEHPLSTWSAAHFEELALLDPAAQVEVLEENDGFLDELSPADLRHIITRRTHDLARAPWDLADEALLPAAGACSACPLRTSREPLLFPEEEWPSQGEGKRSRKGGPVDRCLQPGCWQRKTEALLVRKEAELTAKHPGTIRLTTTGRREAVPSWHVERATRKTPGAVPALAIDGPNLGSVQWVTVNRSHPSSSFPSGASASSPPIDTPAGPRRSTLAERKSRREARRMLLAIERLAPDVEASTVIPPLAQVAALAAVFGTRHTGTCGWYTPDHELPASLADPPAEGLYLLAHEYGAADAEILAATLWQRVRPVLLARLKTNDRPDDAARAFAEARHLAHLCGLDADTYLAQATAELPDPKSWAKEEAALQAAQAQAPTKEPEPTEVDDDALTDATLHAVYTPPDPDDPSAGDGPLCPECGDPLPPGRILCDTCDDGDPDPGDDLDLADDPLPLGPLDAEALSY